MNLLEQIIFNTGPGDLGFYDLRMPGVLRDQAAIARRYGIFGFCFHHYWFSGKRLLETPLNNLLASRDIDLQFCINWANENLVAAVGRLREEEILIAQDHTPDDDISFERALEPLFDDPRYIGIDGRPLVMIYRPGILPDPQATVDRWRTHFKKAGLKNPYIVMAQAFGDYDPRKYGLDAAVGFPPINVNVHDPDNTSTSSTGDTKELLLDMQIWPVGI